MDEKIVTENGVTSSLQPIPKPDEHAGVDAVYLDQHSPLADRSDTRKRRCDQPQHEERRDRGNHNPRTKKSLPRRPAQVAAIAPAPKKGQAPGN